MTDTANAPERIWMTAEDRGASWPGAFRAFRCSDLDHSNDDGPNPDYPEYVLATHCDELVAAARAEGAREAQAKIARLTEALDDVIMCDHHNFYDGPPPRFVQIARAALQENANE